MNKKTFIYLTKIAIFAILIVSCAPSNRLNSINNRSELRKEQNRRQKNAQYWEKQEAKENKAKIKQQKKEERKYNKELKKKRKRHLEWQDDDVKARIKQNKKEAEKALRKKAK